METDIFTIIKALSPVPVFEINMAEFVLFNPGDTYKVSSIYVFKEQHEYLLANNKNYNPKCIGDADLSQGYIVLDQNLPQAKKMYALLYEMGHIVSGFKYKKVSAVGYKEVSFFSEMYVIKVVLALGLKELVPYIVRHTESYLRVISSPTKEDMKRVALHPEYEDIAAGVKQVSETKEYAAVKALLPENLEKVEV